MLAGDVQVTVAGDDLIVIGDDNPNFISIQGTGVAGGYIIEGLGTNVSLNGTPQGGEFIVTGATGIIIIDLNGGDDALLINNVNVDELIINTDDGDDLVALGPFEEALNLGIDLPSSGGGGGGGGGEGGPLPTGPEVNNGNLIDNDVAANTIGHLELLVDAAGDSEQGGFTAQGENLLFVNANFIFQYFGYIDVDGDISQLSDTTITQAPTLVGPDVVESRGSFQGDNTVVNWIATTSIEDGDTRITTTITFTSVTPLPPSDGESPSVQDVRSFGDLNFISFLDADIGVDAADDIMVPSGTPGSPDFKVLTLDSDERVGLAHGGIYTAGTGLVNATWRGWTSDAFDDVQEAIEGFGGAFSTAGTIDVGTGPQQLPQSTDSEFGTIFGPRDIETAFGWRIDPQATSATVTFFIELVPGEPAPDVQGLGGSVGVNDLLVINTHGGNDVVAALRVFGDATWDINLGDEFDGTTNLTDDQTANNIIPGVPLNDQAFVFLASGGDIDINGGTGDDLVNINYLTANGVLVVDAVTGNDVISVNGSVFKDDVVLVGGSGADTVAVDFSRHDAGRNAVIVIDSGADADFILFARSLVRDGVVSIVSGAGNDRVIVGLYYADILGNLATGGNEARVISIDTDGGNDTADIRANLVEELFGLFGSGDDTVTVAFNHITSDDTVGLGGGGGGFDKLSLVGNIFGEHVHIHDFESIINFLFGDGGSESPGTDA
jgi:hypothetical protein